MRYLSCATLFALLLLLAACGQAPTSGASQPTQPAAPTQPPAATTAHTQPAVPTQAPEATLAPKSAAPTQPPTATTAPKAGGANDVVVIFHRSGGIAGVDDSLTVYADGKLQLSGRGSAAKQAEAAPAQIAELQKLLASPEFTALQSRYQAVGADQFVYELTIPSGGKQRMITTIDGAKNPPVLDEVLRELKKLWAQVK
jgi:hypothetical protein